MSWWTWVIRSSTLASWAGSAGKRDAPPGRLASTNFTVSALSIRGLESEGAARDGMVPFGLTFLTYSGLKFSASTVIIS